VAVIFLAKPLLEYDMRWIGVAVGVWLILTIFIAILKDLKVIKLI
jgi:hypothetical protein